MKNILWQCALLGICVLVIVLESTAGYIWLGFVMTWLVAQSLSSRPAWVWIGLASLISATVLQVPFTLVSVLVIGGWWLWNNSKSIVQIPTLRMMLVSSLCMIVLVIWQKVSIQPLIFGCMCVSLSLMLLLFRWWWRRVV